MLLFNFWGGGLVFLAAARSGCGADAPCWPKAPPGGASRVRLSGRARRRGAAAAALRVGGSCVSVVAAHSPPSCPATARPGAVLRGWCRCGLRPPAAAPTPTAPGQSSAGTQAPSPAGCVPAAPAGCAYNAPSGRQARERVRSAPWSRPAPTAPVLAGTRLAAPADAASLGGSTPLPPRQGRAKFFVMWPAAI